MKSKQTYDISTEWNNFELGKICNIITGKLNSNAAEDFGAYVFFTCSKEDYRINSYSFDCEAILLAGNNAVGDFGIKHYKGKFDAYQRTYVITVKNETEFDYSFLFYSLKQKLDDFRRYSFGTATQYLTKTILEPLEICAPEIQIQQKIGKTLDDLDSKIQNLQNQNKVLEQMAQAIFQSWFVDFDGVTEFEDSDLGKIPKGWSVDRIKNFVELIKGVSYKSKELLPSNKALVTLKSIVRGGGYTERGLKSFDGKYKDDQIINENDIIIAQTDLTQSADVIGKPAIIRNSKEFDVLIASLDLLIVRPKNNEIPKSYLYYLFMTDEFQNHVYGYTSGTTVLHLAKNGVPSYVFLLPPKESLKKFNKYVSNLLEKIHNNHHQIETLTKTRDTLLPKLMSGEIRV